MFFFILVLVWTSIFPFANLSQATAATQTKPESTSLSTSPSSISSTAKAKKDEVSVEISSFATPWLDPAADLEFNIDIANGTANEFQLSEISVGAQNMVANSQYLLYYWMNGIIVSRPLFSFSTNERVPAGEVKTVKVRVPRSEIPWSTAEFGWGPRGIEACVVPASEDLSKKLNQADLCDRSVTIVTTTQKINPMPLAVSYPLTLNSAQILETPNLDEILTSKPDNSLPENSSDIDFSDTTVSKQPADTQLAPDSLHSSLSKQTVQDLTQTISRFQLSEITFFVDPVLLEDATLAEELRHTSVIQKLLLPYSDVDLQTLISAGHTDQIDAAFALANTIQKDIGFEKNASDTRIAVLEHIPDEATLQELVKLGIDSAIVSGAQQFFTDEFFYTQEATRKVALNIPNDTAVSDSSSFTLLLNNDQISNSLAGKLTTYQDAKGIDISLADRAQIALALSAIYFNEAPNLNRPLLIQIPRTIANAYADSETQQILANTVASLTQAPWLKTSSVTSLINHDAPIRALPNSAQLRLASTNFDEASTNTPISTAEIESLLQARENFLLKARIFTNYAEIETLAQRDTLKVFANSWRSVPNERQKYLHNAFDASVITKGLKFEPSSTINMISESSSLPVRVHNSFQHEVKVQIDLIPPDQRLSSDQAVLATLPANQTSSVAIPVKAHGSGNIRVLLKVFDPDGNELGPRAYLNMRIRANWENTGTAILASLFFAVLTFGIYRSVKSGRRAKPMSQAEIESGIPVSPTD